METPCIAMLLKALSLPLGGFDPEHSARADAQPRRAPEPIHEAEAIVDALAIILDRACRKSSGSRF